MRCQKRRSRTSSSSCVSYVTLGLILSKLHTFEVNSTSSESVTSEIGPLDVRLGFCIAPRQGVYPSAETPEFAQVSDSAQAPESFIFISTIHFLSTSRTSVFDSTFVISFNDLHHDVASLLCLLVSHCLPCFSLDPRRAKGNLRPGWLQSLQQHSSRRRFQFNIQTLAPNLRKSARRQPRLPLRLRALARGNRMVEHGLRWPELRVRLRLCSRAIKSKLCVPISLEFVDHSSGHHADAELWIEYCPGSGGLLDDGEYCL